MDIVSRIIEYESGELDDEAIFELFAELIRTGLAWNLQGHYGRIAIKFIELGWINRQGEIKVHAV